MACSPETETDIKELGALLKQLDTSNPDIQTIRKAYETDLQLRSTVIAQLEEQLRSSEARVRTAWRVGLVLWFVYVVTAIAWISTSPPTGALR